MSLFSYQELQLEYIHIPAASLRGKWLRKLRRKPTTILFLHGINDPYQNHLDILSSIAAKGFDIFALNFPGHGDSSLPGKVTWNLLVDIVNAFAVAQNLNNVILMGYSMGGGISLKLLETNPAWLKRSVLIAPFCVPFNAMDLIHIKGYLEEFVGKHVHQHLKPAPRLDHPAQVLQHYGPIFLDYGVDVQKLNQPTTILLNTDDHVILATKVKELFKDVSGIRFVDMPGFAHDLYYISEQELSDYVAAIIQHGT